ncbi:glycosyltransferase [Nonomuraea cavernae]|uniref:glycosyltransferase n=1 Tax=Nonomuraea cavernae TaxID=2045107 RepID=UPI0033D3C93F
MKRTVFVSVGTDHHDFSRLVGWCDTWAAAHRDEARCVVQHGTSRPPRHAEGHAYLGHEEVDRLMAEAAVIVSHGGPTTIAEARRRGVKPIVVPRSPVLNEHVDDHQQLFCARLAASGLIAVAGSEAELGTLVSRALTHRAEFTAEHAAGSVAQAVERFEGYVNELLKDRR